jgi:hypothetical protein
MILKPSTIGLSYPNISGSNSSHDQGIERLSLRGSLMLDIGNADRSLLIESGNMLIMTCAYARASGDGSLINRYVRQGPTFFPKGLMVSDSIRC